jgi:hypothetical protein
MLNILAGLGAILFIICLEGLIVYVSESSGEKNKDL